MSTAMTTVVRDDLQTTFFNGNEVSTMDLLTLAGDYDTSDIIKSQEDKYDIYSINIDNIGSPAWCTHFDFFNYVILLGIITLFGVPGNIIAAITLWPKVNSNSTSFLLVTLAILDNCNLILMYIGKSAPIICIYFNIGEAYMNFVYPVFQAFGWYMIHILVLWASYTVVLISFCRYIAVCKPHNTDRFTSMKKVRIFLAMIIVGNVLFYSPRFFRSKIVYSEDRTKFVRKLTQFSMTTSFFVYNAPIYYIVSFLIPFTALVVMTYFQVKALKESKQKRIKMTKSKREEHDVTVTLIIVVIVFLVCQIWEPIRRLSEQLPIPYTDCSNVKYHAYSLKVFFSSVNSAINIVIYCIFGKQFRRDVIRRVFRYRSIHPMFATSFAPNETTAGKQVETSDINI